MFYQNVLNKETKEDQKKIENTQGTYHEASSNKDKQLEAALKKEEAHQIQAENIEK